jgi:hypothetical protein
MEWLGRHADSIWGSLFLCIYLAGMIFIFILGVTGKLGEFPDLPGWL